MGATFPHAEYREVSIPSGQALSDAVELNGLRVAKIYMPAAWTAAALTLAESPKSDGTFDPVYEDATEVQLPATTVVAASRVITVSENLLPFACGKFVRLRSGTAATPVNQEAKRTIGLLLVG